MISPNHRTGQKMDPGRRVVPLGDSLLDYGLLHPGEREEEMLRRFPVALAVPVYDTGTSRILELHG